jgi:hypothetical protein
MSSKKNDTQPVPVNVGTTPTYKVDYKLGIMINYAVTKEAVAPYVQAPLTPIPVHMLQSDKEAKYYVSLYLAICGMNDNPQETSRADVFTYIADDQGRPGLLFLSVLCDIPPMVPEAYVDKYIKMQESFFLDPSTGKCAVPHQRIDKLTMTQEELFLKMGDTVFESKFMVQDTQLFHNDFVVANSQIFHTAKERTVNYFNQEFISAPISDIDLASVQQVAPEKFHPLCTMSNLESVQKYGDASNPITWYFKARL